MVAIVLLMHAVAIRFVNYAHYHAAITAAVLILLDLLQPTNYAAAGDRVLWALCGVGIDRHAPGRSARQTHRPRPATAGITTRPRPA
jgi:hypothetical protein